MAEENKKNAFGRLWESTKSAVKYIKDQVNIYSLFANDTDFRGYYGELPGNEINTVQLIEPAVEVEEFIIPKKDMVDSNNILDKYAFNIPMVSIDDNRINAVDLCSFKLDYSEFIPSVVFEFVDTLNLMLSVSVPKAGSIIKIYIGGNGDELYYKPIRQDFVLTSIQKVGGGTDNMKGKQVMKYRVYGKLNIPYGYRKDSWDNGEATVMETLFNLALWTGLGFATNFTKKSHTKWGKPLDQMRWLNPGGAKTYFEFIQDVTDHALYDMNTFFTSFIDQYNVLNYIECHSLLSHGGKKEDTPAMIYKAYPPQSVPKYDPGTEKTTKNQLPLDADDDDFNNRFQKLEYYFLTNNEDYNGWTNYIQEYHEISNGGNSLTDGDALHLKYTTDKNGKIPFGTGTMEFIIRPVDNLKRDNDYEIMSLPEKPNADTYIPLNLVNVMSYGKSYSKDNINDMSGIESHIDLGDVKSDNVCPLYYYAEAQNKYQMKCMKKCGLKVKLQNYNPAVTKFSRVWVDIYDKNDVSSREITKETIYNNDNTDLSSYKKYKNDNILMFEGECAADMYGKYNRGLSGWYVVTSIEIDYNTRDNNLNMNLILNRIEYRPSFMDEYQKARTSIETYKKINTLDQYKEKAKQR